jgi:hypothetical protein
VIFWIKYPKRESIDLGNGCLPLFCGQLQQAASAWLIFTLSSLKDPLEESVGNEGQGSPAREKMLFPLIMCFYVE